eukprot:TRINITY_DN3255_c0_g1_i1.p1 TRINITY_DN3255_c0_g1~~TRINITY_DN3255_c0_g1_i1.p1  ORF type:complete len:125 (-),score=16.99 TRINITY_DN3255_c0_g1_i1:290-664(-)
MDQSGFRIVLAALPLLFLSLFFMSADEAMAEGDSKSSVYIVYLANSPPENAEYETFHLQTLSSVFSTPEEAREALLYSYKSTINGFSAKLTPEQVDRLSKQPGVLQVMPSQVYHLHGGGRRAAV